MLDGLRECYRILDVEPGASLEEVKRSYRELVKVWHPDRFANDTKLQAKAQEKLKQINLAYERICKGEPADSSGRTRTASPHPTDGEQQRSQSSPKESQGQAPGNYPPSTPRPEPSQAEANQNRPPHQPGTEAQWSYAAIGFGFLALTLWLAPTLTDDFAKYEAGEGIRTTRKMFLLYQLFGKQGVVAFFLVFGFTMGYFGLCHARALLSGQSLIQFGLKKGHLIAAAVILGFFVLTGDRPERRITQRQQAYSQTSLGDSVQRHSAVGMQPERQFAPGQKTGDTTAHKFASKDVFSERPAAHGANAKTGFKDQKDKVSYAIGLNISRSLKNDGMEVNPDALAAGISDALSGAKPQLTDEETQTVMQAFQRELMPKETIVRENPDTDAKAPGSVNMGASEAFLAKNKKKEGVMTTASGLQYKVIRDGTGKTPKPTDTVKTHYRGTLINGTEIDSSYKRGEPAEFPVNGVIRGWAEALQLMKEGAKWQLFIPADLAYGERGAGKDIGPNSTLIFDIELISVGVR